MSYTTTIADALIETLSRISGLPAFQLAGHVPNLDFWMAEVRHVVGVIDGYQERFANMSVAQAAFGADHVNQKEQRERHEHDYQPLTPAISPAAADRLKRRCVQAANRLIDRCLKEELIYIVKADDLRSAIRSSNE